MGWGINQLDKKRMGFVERKKEKRITSFYEREMEGESMSFPSLSHTFRSIDFIHPGQEREKEEKSMLAMDEAFKSLKIGMIKREGPKMERPELHPFLRG